MEHGIYHSPNGYRVAIPPAGWSLVEESRSDLELRAGREAGLLVNSTCDPATVRERPRVLTRHLLLGLRDGRLIERADVTLAGRRGVRTVLEGRMQEAADRVRIEAYVVKDDRCVYDLVYVAAPETFDRWRPDFARVVESFATE